VIILKLEQFFIEMISRENSLVLSATPLPAESKAISIPAFDSAPLLELTCTAVPIA